MRPTPAQTRAAPCVRPIQFGRGIPFKLAFLNSSVASRVSRFNFAAADVLPPANRHGEEPIRMMRWRKRAEGSVVVDDVSGLYTFREFIFGNLHRLSVKFAIRRERFRHD